MLVPLWALEACDLNSTVTKMLEWVVCQLGAREHYAIPRALLRAGRLGALCTDMWAGAFMRGCVRFVGRPGAALAGRFHSGIPAGLVTHWTKASLWRQLGGGGGHFARYYRFVEDGAWFGERVREWLAKQTGLPDVLFSYDTTALEPFASAKGRGSRLLLGQMDPGRTHYEILAAERERWPRWEPDGEVIPEEYHERRAAEWDLADIIIVNSRWSREALLQQGVPSSKLVVVPLVYEGSGPTPETPHRACQSGPLRVLFLGKVNLAKGVAYLLDAARLLAPDAVQIEIVGSIGIGAHIVAGAPANVRFSGAVDRSAAAACYRRADVFVLPTLSDGFAITQLEAMAHGLPVITTSNCGEVVTDGEDGLIVPARDAAALALAIESLAGDRERLRGMSECALKKSRQFTIDRLAADLLALESVAQ